VYRINYWLQGDYEPFNPGMHQMSLNKRGGIIMRAKFWILVAAALLLAGFAISDQALAMSVSLNPSVPSPAPLGTIVTWTASVPNSGSATLWYRFRAGAAGADLQMVRDYGPESSLDWTESETEGTFQIEVSARNLNTGESATTTATYVMASRITGNTPVINPTANPLVFLYSAPPCSVGSQMTVYFQSPVGVVNTPFTACKAGLSMNFYIAGLAPRSTYSVHHMIQTASGVSYGPSMTLTTPSVSVSVPSASPLLPVPLPFQNGIVLNATLTKMTMATDLYGNLLWYYPGQISYLTRPLQNGHMFGVFEAFGSDQSMQILREFDLAWTTLRETNAARINEQLASMGVRPIGAFHHEARALPNGYVLVLASAEQIMTNIQGTGNVDVMGDVILVLDQNLQVTWAWDSFQYLDWTRMATLGEVCTLQAAGCPPYYQAQQVNDWLHGNSVSLTPDGNILYSARHQDWVIKIAYANGIGDGHIMWRLGKGGDFKINSADPNVWFSHQHDAQYEAGHSSTIVLFDDGNVRRVADPAAHSRGQVLQLDEQNLVATLVVNADLGDYSPALGSAQKLANGNYHFDQGWLQPSNTSQAIEVDRLGNKVFTLQLNSPAYRSFRLTDLYTPYDPQPAYYVQGPDRQKYWNYYNGWAQPYTNEPLGYWQAIDGIWWQGETSSGKITPLNSPPWLIP
jgi:arylsulfate sulfotransferase